MTRNSCIPCKAHVLDHAGETHSLRYSCVVARDERPITVEAVREIGIAEGSEVIAIVKASDVMVAVAD